jgi:hypothetical protein
MRAHNSSLAGRNPIHRGRFAWAVLALALFFCATLFLLRLRHRHTDSIAIPFQIPSSDRVHGGLGPRETATAAPGQFMALDPTHKFLMDFRTNKPVFITGDSPWSLEVQLSDSDIQLYLADRALKGFNAIWIGLADNVYSNHPPADFYGNVPFNGADFTNENPAYWSRVDQTIAWAADRGIAVLADPAFVGPECRDGYCESYRRSSEEVVRRYGEFLGDRYKRFPNIVWLIGGDADPRDADVQAKLYVLAKGIKSKDPYHLMTTENYRGTSSIDIWSGAPWLDLDALYLKPQEILAKANSDYLLGTYPVFMMEDWYEGEHSITELEVRQEGYYAVLSGATMGRLFGNYAIWNFSWSRATSDSWKSQLNSTGSLGQVWLGELFRSREHWKLVPDVNHTVMTSGYDSRSFFSATREFTRSLMYDIPYRVGSDSPVAAGTSDGQTLIAYVPHGNATTITIEMSKITDSESKARCWWFNPRDASTALIGNFATRGALRFTPPDSNDWVLVIDSLSANLAPPGSADVQIP